MKKIFIKLDLNKKKAEIGHKIELYRCKYYNYMLIGTKFSTNEARISLIEIKEKDVLGYVIKLNTILLFILKRNSYEALILLRKNNKNKYYNAHKAFNKYFADFGYIIIKDYDVEPIIKNEDIAIYSQQIYVKIKFNEYDDIYENYNQDIYKIKRIIY